MLADRTTFITKRWALQLVREKRLSEEYFIRTMTGDRALPPEASETSLLQANNSQQAIAPTRHSHL